MAVNPQDHQDHNNAFNGEHKSGLSERGAALGESTDDILDQGIWWKVLIGMVAGIGFGLIFSPETFGVLDIDLAYEIGEWTSLIGVIFLALIQMVIVPLIVCSIIVGIVDSGSLSFVKKMVLRVIPYFVATTAIAITIGITLVTLIQPGAYIDPDLVERAMGSGAMAGAIPDQTFDNLSIPERIANILPSNLTQAQLQQNILPIVIAAILGALAMLSLKARHQDHAIAPLYGLCVAGQVLSMKIISWAMVLAPYAVFGLLANVVIQLGVGAVLNVALYMVTVILGLICMLGVYMILVGGIARISPRFFLSQIKDVQLLAFSTSSSGATMPFTIKAAEDRLNLRHDISRFTIPLGTTINMDGTALYQSVAALFLCQIFQIQLDFQDILLLLVTTIGASIGTPATPGVGLIILATILVSLGVPVEGLALILGVDRILDMCRTTINVTGDLTAASVMNRIMGKVDNKVDDKAKP